VSDVEALGGAAFEFALTRWSWLLRSTPSTMTVKAQSAPANPRHSINDRRVRRDWCYTDLRRGLVGGGRSRWVGNERVEPASSRLL